MTAKPRILIFDLDKTITRFPTFPPFLWRAVRRTMPWRVPLFVGFLPLFIGYGLKLLDRKGLKQAMHRLALGNALPRQRVEAIAQDFAAYMADGNLYGEAQQLIDDARDRGDRVIIATASNRFYVTALAHRLGVEEIVATESVWHGDRLSPTIAGENCYGEGKRRMLNAYFVKAGIDPADYRISFYSDHVSDLPVFEMSDHSVAANPSKKLRAVARQRGWEIQDW